MKLIPPWELPNWPQWRPFYLICLCALLLNTAGLLLIVVALILTRLHR